MGRESEDDEPFCQICFFCRKQGERWKIIKEKETGHVNRQTDK